MPWFLRDSERLKLERSGIEELSLTVDWLLGTEWRLDGELCLDAVIRAHGHSYEVRLSFPALYPDAPTVVRPRNVQSRVSRHQYGGPDGPLCLEWGPDNWHRDITAVQMLQSTYRLFDTENPLGNDRPEAPVVAPSRHKLTIGQELRGQWARWYASHALQEFFASQPMNAVGSFKFSLRKTGENWTGLLHEALPIGGSVWKDLQIPTLPNAGADELDIGVWFKTDLEGKTIGGQNKLADLQTLLSKNGGKEYLATDGTSPVPGFQRPLAGVLIVDKAGEMHLFVVLAGDKLLLCSAVRPETISTISRAPDSTVFTGKTIGIVGMGSAGSKIATSLTRMGARKFYIVDHDILLPENLQRHALDWQGVIQHKVDAMAAAIHKIAADAQVEICRLNLTGQESNALVSGAMKRLGESDLLIDATANPKLFNLLTAIVRTTNRPMIWCEVFAGGIGGLVARSRPGLDPSPHDMRNAYLQYCTDNPFPSSKSAEYATEASDGEVLVASDADISIIAHHAARFASDCLVPAENSKFPYSMYLIGLTRNWVFDAPFATIPISMASYNVEKQNNNSESELLPENAEFLLGLIQKRANEVATTSGNNKTVD
jgi:sulfur-carrier protein adenylyltransferase/sulfurtransferase